MPREQSVPRRAPQNLGDRRSASGGGGGSSVTQNPLTPPPRDNRTGAAAAAPPSPRRDLHGSGLEYTLPSGAKYIGDFSHGLMHGNGRYEYTNGDIYEGDFRNDKIEGYGVYLYEHGDEYEGEWRHGHRTGKGTYVFGHNGSLLQGMWRHDQPHGFGKLLMPSEQGDVPRYEGHWEDSMRHGLGVQRQPNGSFYDGQWERGREDGLGVLQGADGSLYCGEWRAGQRDGRGIIIEHGHKYLVEFNLDYQTSRREMPSDTKKIPRDFVPVHEHFLKWWEKTRGSAHASPARSGRNGQTGGDVSAQVVDREMYENVVAEKKELEQALDRMVAANGGGGGDDDDDEAMLTSSDDPETLKKSIRRVVEQRNVERQRARIAEQKVQRLRASGVDVDGGSAGTAAAGGDQSSSSARSVRGASSSKAAAADEEQQRKLQEQMQQMESELKAKEAKIKEAERRNIAAQNNIEELQAEVANARMTAAAAAADKNSNGAAASSSARGGGAGSSGHRPSMTPKPQDTDEISRLNFELARLKRELEEAVLSRDEMEKKYGKEKEKHKRAGRERDIAKANLQVREQEAALNERLFRLIGAGQALMLGVVTAGGALNVGDDGRSITCSSPDVAFDMDAVYANNQMAELEDEWANAVTGVRNGYSCAMLMLGSDETARGSLVSGVLPAVVNQLFNATQQMQHLYDVTISMSFVEVARQNVTDLLSSSESAANITIVKDARGTIAFEGASRQPVSSADEAVRTWSKTMDQLKRRVSNKLLVFWVDAVDKASKATFHGKLLLADICATTASNAPLVATESCNLLCNALTEFSRSDTYQHRNEPLLMALNDAIGGPTRTIFMFAAGAERALSGSTQSMLQTLSECREKVSNFPLQHFETPHALALQKYVAEKAPRELPPRFFPLNAAQ